ncbi:MAG: NosD domain-containing protein, partial [Candidatus Woesearchaeota archaeon]
IHDSNSEGLNLRLYDYIVAYNNLFNNTNNIFSWDFDEDNLNTWNTTLQTGNRITGAGSYIGGNYYATPAGTGFSETCADADTDGICDSPFNLLNESSCTAGVDCSNNTDYLPLSSGFVPNSPPTIELIYPGDGNSTINRTPTLIWNATDDDGDQMNFTINITCHPACSDDNRYYETGFTDQFNYTIPVDLKYLWDDNYYYNWTVRAYDGMLYSDWAPEWNFSVKSLVMLTLDPSTIHFGTASVNESNSTTDDIPLPIGIHNDGNCYLNISFETDDYLWDSVESPSDYHLLKTDYLGTETSAFDYAQSTTSWTQVSTANNTIVAYLNYSENNNSAELDMNLTVPFAEPTGLKNLTFTIVGEYVSVN